MAMARFTVTMSWGEEWTLLCDFNNDTCPISTEEPDGEVRPTPYVSGAAARSPLRAARLIAEWWDATGCGGYLGGDGHVVSVEEAA